MVRGFQEAIGPDDFAPLTGQGMEHMEPIQEVVVGGDADSREGMVIGLSLSNPRLSSNEIHEDMPPSTRRYSDNSLGGSSHSSLAPSPSRDFSNHKRHSSSPQRRRQSKDKLPETRSYGSFGSFVSLLHHLPHFQKALDQSKQRHRLNKVLCFLLVLTNLVLASVGMSFLYYRIILPREKQKLLNVAIKAHAEAAAQRAEQCREVNWQTACDRLGAAGAGARRRRRLRRRHEDDRSYSDEDDEEDEEEEEIPSPMEQQFLDSNDPTVTFDGNCLKTYRLQMFGNITFPYYASHLLYEGGNHTMALFIQHGALRDAPTYFCSFKELMLRQHYRPFSEILIIAPDFSYEHDPFQYPNDAFWNSSKPWGDWRVGAESDPKCCGDSGRTVSSFDVLDHMLAMLTSKKLFPKMDKVSFVGHSAGAQMVQRYAVMSVLASLYGIGTDVNVEFIVANPSSYTYLDNRRYQYSCGHCNCTSSDCKCDGICTEPPYNELAVPSNNSSQWPCYRWNYDRWPYGIGSFSNKKGQSIPYALRDGFVGVDRALRIYRELHVVYMVGQNDTCNDMLPTCDASCWKRTNFTPELEWPCFRNDMDTRCQAMLQGPCRRTRAWQYLQYLRELYGEPIHALIEVPGVGHNASAMFGSRVGMRELFGSTNIH